MNWLVDGLPAERRGWAAVNFHCAGVGAGYRDRQRASAIAADLHVGPADVIWVVNVYRLPGGNAVAARSAGEIVGHRRFISQACCSPWRRWLCLRPSLLQPADGARAAGSGRGIMSVNTALVCSVYPGRLQGRVSTQRAVVATAFTLGPTIASGIRDRAVELAVCHQHSLGLVAIVIGLKTLPRTASDYTFSISRRGVGCGVLAFSFLGSEAAITRPDGIDRTCRRRAAWLGSDPQTGRSSGARAADRPVCRALSTATAICRLVRAAFVSLRSTSRTFSAGRRSRLALL
jgi:DHA2 family multidrug resistance protein-like MFS transporter